MNDFLDLVLARSYAQPLNLVQPRPMLRFELPDLPAPDIEAPVAAQSSSAPSAEAGVTLQPVPIPMPAASPVITHELLRTRELLTIRELQPVPAASHPQQDIRLRRPEPPAPGIAPVREPALPGLQTELQPATQAEVQPVVIHTSQHAVPPMPQVLPMLPRSAQDELPLTRRTDMPIVHVRIGRIEVQSPAAPTNPVRPIAVRSAPAPVRPVRSLDDYLRRRNEEH